jgi:hypothetical protein
MYYKPRNTLQSRSLTPRALTYRLLNSKSKIKLGNDYKPFTALSSEISASVTNILKPSLSIRNLNSHRISAPGTHLISQER